MASFFATLRARAVKAIGEQRQAVTALTSTGIERTRAEALVKERGAARIIETARQATAELAQLTTRRQAEEQAELDRLTRESADAIFDAPAVTGAPAPGATTGIAGLSTPVLAIVLGAIVLVIWLR